MKQIKFYLKDIGIFFSILMIIVLLGTFLNYINVISYKAVSVINFITLGLLFIYVGLSIARKSERKGYKSGFIISTIISIILFLMSIVTSSKITFSIIFYYLILIICGIVGGMIGINFKQKK